LELWRSDGTSDGTYRIKDIRPGIDSSQIAFMTNVNGMLAFTANDGTHGPEPWQSDGTAEGTQIIRDINPGALASNSQNLRAAQGKLFFQATDGFHGTQVWIAQLDLSGDYNSDDKVDAADYTVWRNKLGSTTDLSADGDGDGTVDEDDYGVWKANFGKVRAVGAASAISDEATIAAEIPLSAVAAEAPSAPVMLPVEHSTKSLSTARLAQRADRPAPVAANDLALLLLYTVPYDDKLDADGDIDAPRANHDRISATDAAVDAGNLSHLFQAIQQ
jgi:ELWxxDGT repeat protein